MNARSCVKCGEALAPRLILGVEVDCCPGCAGLWLDEGEVVKLASDPGGALAELRDVEGQLARLARKRGEGAAAASEEQVFATPCPACGGKLGVAVFGPTTIELCGQCGGIFLDQGELEKAMEMVGGARETTIVALARSVRTSGAIGS